MIINSIKYLEIHRAAEGKAQISNYRIEPLNVVGSKKDINASINDPENGDTTSIRGI
jgi:hypothetical protein